MTTKANVFNQILSNTQTINATLIVMSECLALCAEKLGSLEGDSATSEELAALEKQFADYQKETQKTLSDLQKTLDALKKKK